MHQLHRDVDAEYAVRGAQHEAQRPDAHGILDQVALGHHLSLAVRKSDEEGGVQLLPQARSAGHTRRAHLALAAGGATFGRIRDVAAAAVAEHAGESIRLTPLRHSWTAPLNAGGTEATTPARSHREYLHLHQRSTDHRRDNQLRDALAAPEAERRRREVGEDDLHLTPVVRVDGARRVEAGDATLEREAGTRPHLALEARRKSQRKPGGD